MDEYPNWLGMTSREYGKRQCDKCTRYLKCEILQNWLNIWRGSDFDKEGYVSDGTDFAKMCWFFVIEPKIGTM